jgi:quercetin dioxygenase-like cupin family protein
VIRERSEDAVMQRPIHLATAVLAALTALALLGAAVAVRPPGPPATMDEPGESANRALAHAFYAAANVAIETGDLSPLATVVAPDLLADDAMEGGWSGPVGLSRRLLAMHTATPSLRLTVMELAVDGDLVIARVDAVATTMAPFLGLRLVDPSLLWGPVDVLRLANGRIVKFTSGADDTILLKPALAVPRDLLPDDSRVLSVGRSTIAAGATHSAAAVDGFRLLYLETGALTVEVATSDYLAAPGPLAAGAFLAVPAGVAYAALNSGDTPAVLLDLTVSRRLDRPQSGAGDAALLNPTKPPVDAAIRSEVLTNSQTSVLPSGPVILALGWATLAPGARLAWDVAAGPVLLYVEAGEADLDSGTGRALAQNGRGRSTTLNGASLVAGDGALVVDSGAVIHAGADAPAILLIVTLLPAVEPAPISNSLGLRGSA